MRLKLPRTLSPVVLGTLLFVSGPAALAQTVTTGSVSGTILAQAAAAPLAGLTVRLTSAQISRTTVTDEQGRFRAGLLNPGIWRVIVDNPGYQRWSAALVVEAESDTSVRIRLMEVPEATVTVNAPSDPDLDLTSTAATTIVTEADIARLPLARNMNDLIYLAPSATFAGRSDSEGLDYSINGASGAENQFILDGLVTNDFRNLGQGLSLVSEFLDRVQVVTAGYRPEFAALGGVFNATLKSGTNRFTGSAWVTAAPQNLEAQAEANVQGFRQPAPASRWDSGFGLGGPLVKDRVFFYIGVDLDHLNRTPYPNSSGLQGGDQTLTNLQVVAKLNAFLTPEQQLSGTLVWSDRRNETPHAVPAGYGSADLGATQKDHTTLLSLGYDWNVRSDLLFSLNAGFYRSENTTRPEDTLHPLIYDAFWFNGGGGGLVPELATYDFQRGGYGKWGNQTRDTTQFSATLSWFIGSHDFKAGISFLESKAFKQEFTSGPVGENATWSISADGSVITSDVWGNFAGAQVKARYQAFYLQDTWEVARGLRLLYGARMESQEQFDSQGHRLLAFNNLGKYLQPRLGFTWDPGGDGRRKLSGSYAVYYEQLPQVLAPTPGAGLDVGYALAAYSPTGLGILGNQIFVFGGLNGVGLGPPIAEGIQLPRREEISLGYAQLLRTGLTLKASGLWRELTHPIDDSSFFDASGRALLKYADGSPIFVLWNPGSTLTLVAPAGATDVNGINVGGQRVRLPNTLFPDGYNRYLAFTLALDRQGDRSAWSAAYTWSHLWGNYEGLLVADRGDGPWGAPNIAGAFDSWAYVGTGDLPLDRRHIFKLQGSQREVFAGLDWTVGLRWIWMSGIPINLFDDGSATLGLPPGTLGPGNPLDPVGFGVLTPERFSYGTRGRMPALNTLDLRLDTEFKTGPLRLRPSLEIFNVFNSRTPVMVWQYATKWISAEADRRYGAPCVWLEGRRVQFGLRVLF